MKLSIVIPVYNEINTILEILRRVKAVPIDKEIIIVDDCSTDGTREVLMEIKDDNIQLILNEENRGKGFSIFSNILPFKIDTVVCWMACKWPYYKTKTYVQFSS